MSAHALSVIEFPRAMALVAGRAASPLGREAVLARRPSPDPGTVRRELERVGETTRFLSEKAGWGPPAIPDAWGALRRLSLEGSVLEPLELYALGVVLASGRALAAELDRREQSWPALASLRALLLVEETLEAEVGCTVDAEGTVVDSASRELRRIREQLRRAHSRIVRALEEYVRSLPERYVVSDASVTIREGRYVIALRREGKGEVGGLVLGESATGATVFVEPPLAIQLRNELGELEREEAREVQRILRELSARLRPFAAALEGSQEALVDFDSLHARARAALAWRAELPEILDPGAERFQVLGARHPLLLERGDAVVPFDLAMEPGERALVVSGPNTGGKSVFLKAMGLLAALAQSGVVPPVGKGSSLPVFTGIWADIGDEQSIEGSLSTFSAHLANLREILAGADAGSLVLVDEMGTGTDPAEGAALGRAVLEELVRRGALTVATSHLGALKRLDAEGSGIVNASLQFDPDRIEPTYHLVKGRPGRSYGLAIARRLGFPAPVLDRAEGHLSAGEVSVEELLEKLERREKEASRLVGRLEREQAEVLRLRSQLEAREVQLAEQERSADRRAKEEARRLLMEAREEVEEAIREVKAADSEALEEASRSARRRVEEAARRQRLSPQRATRPGRPAVLEVGARVRLSETGASGRLTEIRDGRAVVEAGGLRVELPLDELVGVEEGLAEPAGRGRRSPAYVGPAPEPSAEVDLRGLRVDEVEIELSRALDAAVLGDLPELRIIHGKGTGAVRARVRELLAMDPRVSAFRLGLPPEGGAGVTIARVAP